MSEILFYSPAHSCTHHFRTSRNSNLFLQSTEPYCPPWSTKVLRMMPGRVRVHVPGGARVTRAGALEDIRGLPSVEHQEPIY